MGRDYVVQLHSEDGAWRGTLRGPEGERSFDSIPALLELLRVDPFTQLTRLERQARTDPLTGLLNRRGVAEEVDRVLTAGEREMALLMLDVDNLKQINDIWGHLKGDAVLRKVAQAIRQVGGPGSIVGRLGGDEFVMVLWDVEDDRELKATGEEICRMVTSLESEVHLTVSIGGCKQGNSYEQLMERADLALYRVKRSGKRGVALERAVLEG